MAYEFREGWLRHPFNEDIQAIVAYTPDVVTGWITSVHTYLSLPTIQPKVVFLAVLPDRSHGCPRVLQILVHCRCLFFQLVHAPRPIPDSLRQFLANRLYTFVGSNIGLALGRLHLYYNIGGNDTRRLELRFTFRPPEVSASDWTVRELSAHQIRFCCIDGFASYLITMAM